MIDQEIDAPGHGKVVVDGLNAIDKAYLGKFLCLTSTPEVHTDKKRINIHSMNKEVNLFLLNNSKVCMYIKIV